MTIRLLRKFVCKWGFESLTPHIAKNIDSNFLTINVFAFWYNPI